MKEKNRLLEIYAKMKMAYVKRNFEVMLNYKNLFDNIYDNIPRTEPKYALLIDKVFTPQKISKCLMYIKGLSNSKVQVFGNVKYGLKKEKMGDIEKIYVLIKPKESAEIKIKIVISGNNKKIQIPLTIHADGKQRNMRIISNTDYKKLIKEYSRLCNK